NSRRRAERADRTRRVPEFVVRRLHRETDARRNLVADDNRGQEFRGGCALGLRGGKCGADRRAAGVVDGITEDVVELDGVRGRTVDERCRAQGAELTRAVDVGLTVAELVAETFDHGLSRVDLRA